MMTAILVFLGVSSFATLALITAVVAGARRTSPIDAESEPMILTSSTESKATFVPSYGLQS